ESRDRERQVRREARHDRGEQQHLEAEPPGARPDLFVETLVERETVRDGCDELRGAIRREARGDAEGDRLEGRARTRVAITARRVPQRGVKRATEIERAKGGDERTPRERVVDAVARAAERLGQRRARTHRTFGGAKQPRSRAPRAPPRGVGAEARGERRPRRADREAADGPPGDGPR